jgi:hypothetical protein
MRRSRRVRLNHCRDGGPEQLSDIAARQIGVVFQGPINRAFTLIGQHVEVVTCPRKAVESADCAKSWPEGILPVTKEAHVLSRTDRR